MQPTIVYKEDATRRTPEKRQASQLPLFRQTHLPIALSIWGHLWQLHEAQSLVVFVALQHGRGQHPLEDLGPCCQDHAVGLGGDSTSHFFQSHPNLDNPAFPFPGSCIPVGFWEAVPVAPPASGRRRPPAPRRRRRCWAPDGRCPPTESQPWLSNRAADTAGPGSP